MSSSRLWLDPDEARAYLAACKRDNNRTAENYAERIAARRCIDMAEGWHPDPLPAPSRAAAPVPSKPSRSRVRTRRS